MQRKLLYFQSLQSTGSMQIEPSFTTKIQEPPVGCEGIQ